jgi:hypothetical protein
LVEHPSIALNPNHPKRNGTMEVPKEKEKEKEKMTPVFSYQRECEPVGLILITVFHDAVYGFMPPLEVPNLDSLNKILGDHFPKENLFPMEIVVGQACYP